LEKLKITTRQEEIIRSAGRLISSNGIKSLTTKNLALEMGFSESALYKHFKNKEDIIVMLMAFLLKNMEERLIPISTSENTASQLLQDIFESQFNYFSQHPYLVVAILSEGLFNETEKIDVAIKNIIAFKSGLITKIMNHGVDQGYFTKKVPTSALVHTIMGAFRLTLLKWKLSDFKMDLNTKGNEIIKHNLLLIKLENS
jgi:AcrR family transcriptional regulator